MTFSVFSQDYERFRKRSVDVKTGFTVLLRAVLDNREREEGIPSPPAFLWWLIPVHLFVTSLIKVLQHDTLLAICLNSPVSDILRVCRDRKSVLSEVIYCCQSGKSIFPGGYGVR